MVAGRGVNAAYAPARGAGEPPIDLWVISHGNPPESIGELLFGTLIHDCRHVRLRLL